MLDLLLSSITFVVELKETNKVWHLPCVCWLVCGVQVLAVASLTPASPIFPLDEWVMLNLIIFILCAIASEMLVASVSVFRSPEWRWKSHTLQKPIIMGYFNI